MTTDRKNFIFTVRRGIMAEIEYPGVAQLVGRDIWECRGGIRVEQGETPQSLVTPAFAGFPRLPKTAQKRL